MDRVDAAGTADTGALAAFDRSATQIAALLVGAAHPFPEFAAAGPGLAALRGSLRVRAALAQTEASLADLGDMPQTTYTRFRAFGLRGDREPYETPYYRKRARLHAAAFRVLVGQDDLLDAVQDHLWSICEESTWVVPAHARVIDLMAAETAFGLAEIVALIGPRLDAEVRLRVREEIDRRIFAPFLGGHYDLRWFGGGDNWNGVCSGALGGAFLYLEREPDRLAGALELLLGSLKQFFATAFEGDGSTTEGVRYWQYGLQYVIIFAELLRARTGGGIDLLAAPRIRQVAAYPGAMVLPGGSFVSFADSPTRVPFSPGLTTRLARRADSPALLGVLAPPAPLAPPESLPLILRDLLWWGGDRPEAAPLADATLPAAGIARLVANTRDGAAVAVALKAGHNGENHNHDDVGSFVLHVADEGFLVDPGPGHYDRDYFGDRRYDNIFANSYGHGVPRVAGQLQGTGRAFVGELLGIERDEATGRKVATVEFGRAYALATLVSARRRLIVGTADAEAGTVWLHDIFRFADADHAVEEALLTWLPTVIAGASATISGQRHALRLTIERPVGAHFVLESLERESRANHQTAVLQRLSFAMAAASAIEVRVRMAIVAIP